MRLGNLYEGAYFIYEGSVFQSSKLIFQNDYSLVVCINCATNERVLLTLDTIVEVVISFNKKGVMTYG